MTNRTDNTNPNTPAARTGTTARRRPVRRAQLAPLAAAVALVGAACGSATTTSSPATPGEPTAASTPLDVTASTTTAPPKATGSPDATETVATETVDTEPDVDPADPVDPVDPVDPAEGAAGELTGSPTGLCGSYGPIPPVPDSMPTHLYDTDGDAAADDEVTAYGASDGWRLRVVENGETSEALLPDIDGFAAITNDYQVEGRDYVEVTDFEVETIFTLATVGGCVELLDTRTPPFDLAVPPVDTLPDPDPIGPDDLAANAPSCAALAPIADDASIVSNVSLDLSGDGSADDQVVTYFHGSWFIRSTVDGTTSEVGVDDVGPGAVRAIGTADVGELSAGNELIATVGAGAYSTQLGIYGLDDDNCIFVFVDPSDIPFTLTAGASISFGDTFICGDGYVDTVSWARDADDTFSVVGAAFHEGSLGKFSYLAASDYHDEGLTADELPVSIFDCNGLSL